jgi:hypothetical protein
MKNISFALTTAQIRDGTKTVTRRMGWEKLRPGELLLPVFKCMGLKAGEKVQALREPITLTNVRREPLRRMLGEPDYGATECVAEGFPEMTPAEFVQMFCRSHRGCTPDTVVTRIEFGYYLE